MSELDELPEYFCFPACCCVTPGTGRAELAERAPPAPWDALGPLSAVREEGPAFAFRLWLQGGVGGETSCLFYYVSLYHST